MLTMTGVLSAQTASQTTKCGQTIRLTATADAGYEFSHWQDDPTNTQNTRLVTIDENTSVSDYVAVFVQTTFTITAQSADATMGSVTQTELTGHLGDQVTFNAVPASRCYVFDHWEDADGNSIGTSASITHTIAANTTLYAVFKEADITITASGTNGSVAIEVL